jgi:hypothetical protein
MEPMMSTGLARSSDRAEPRAALEEPSAASIGIALATAFLLVALTRLPLARTQPLESDEFGFLDQVATHWFPIPHTLYLTCARVFGLVAGDPYRGFVWLDVGMSSVAIVSAWWWLRAIAAPRVALSSAVLLGVAPSFWTYGAMAGNYTAIIAVGSFLLGVAVRTHRHPAAWHPLASAVVLAMGTGYRQDIGTFWLPVLLVTLWHHRWPRAFLALVLFAALNLAWLGAMIHEAGGWASYRAQTADFAYNAGYMNSVWHLGLVDAPLRYLVKLGMALVWTLGPCLLAVPRGFLRVRSAPRGAFLSWLLVLSVSPALFMHLTVHFGVPGYAFHYLPALLALVAIGIGPTTEPEVAEPSIPTGTVGRLLVAAGLMATLFLFYPTRYDRPGWRGSFDLAFARQTRIGLRAPLPDHQPAHWRTANSRVEAGNGLGHRRSTARAN